MPARALIYVLCGLFLSFAGTLVAQQAIYNHAPTRGDISANGLAIMVYPADSVASAADLSFPVNFWYSISELISTQIALPEGWEVVALFTTKSLQLPGEAGQCNNSSQQPENRLQRNADIDIDEMYLPSQYYPQLCNQMGEVAANIGEQVVLKNS